ncbi:hypothetical protein EAE96_010452 [Botrytis aclada]|nr:hypothetical protein EAE96_010452 [Botrytis aclada]
MAGNGLFMVQNGVTGVRNDDEGGIGDQLCRDSIGLTYVQVRSSLILALPGGASATRATLTSTATTHSTNLKISAFLHHILVLFDFSQLVKTIPGYVVLIAVDVIHPHHIVRHNVPLLYNSRWNIL